MELWLLIGAALALGLGGLSSGSSGGGSDGGDDSAGAEGPPPTQEGDGGDNLLEGSPVVDDAIYGRGGSDT
nr:hypothetical protein [Paracoccaceae bacterium]